MVKKSVIDISVAKAIKLSKIQKQFEDIFRKAQDLHHESEMIRDSLLKPITSAIKNLQSGIGSK